MRVFDNGSFFTVHVLTEDVVEFKRTWPCSDLPDRPIRFEFDKRNGDLVDMHPTSIDGADASALAADARAQGIKRLNLTGLSYLVDSKE